MLALRERGMGAQRPGLGPGESARAGCDAPRRLQAAGGRCGCLAVRLAGSGSAASGRSHSEVLVHASGERPVARGPAQGGTGLREPEFPLREVQCVSLAAGWLEGEGAHHGGGDVRRRDPAPVGGQAIPPSAAPAARCPGTPVSS